MEEDTILEVEAYLDGITGEIPFAKGEKIGRTVDYAIGRNRYIGYLISLATRSYEGLKVGLDCANGSAWMIAKNVFDTLGARTYVIHNNPDGININQGCGSTHIEALQKHVMENGLDVGFAFDGDADRCLCVDEHGNVVDGDAILYIYGCYMKERGKLAGNKVVTTIMSTRRLTQPESNMKRPQSETSTYMKIWKRTATGSAGSSPATLFSGNMPPQGTEF